MEHGTTIAALLMAALIPMTGCLGLFDGEEATADANATSISQNVGNQTAQEIESRTSGQFRNFTIPGQEDLATSIFWMNGTLDPGQAAAGWEDRNDRSGTNYNTEYVVNDISSELPAGQPAEIHAKMWYLPGPGNSGDLDIYMNVPGLDSDFAGDDCDAFSWKICVQEVTVTTVGVDGEPAEVGVQMANGRTAESMDYFMQVEIQYVGDVITPRVPYAFDVPKNASGIVISSEKAGGGEHIDAELLVIGPDDELVEYVTYNDIAIPTEQKLIPVSKPGEYILYAIELHGGFLAVEADVPVPQEAREARVLDTKEESVIDATGPAPGAGENCIPSTSSASCTTNTTYQEGGTSSFSVEGTFPLEITGFIGEEGSPHASANTEVRISSSEGIVHKVREFAKYEDERGTIGSSRDALNTWTSWENLAKGEYTVSYVIDGNAAVGHTVLTYVR